MVHINAGVAGLVGAYVIGKRVGYGKESMRRTTCRSRMIGASPAVGGLVRLQRRLQPRSNGHCRDRVPQHDRRHRAAVLGWLLVESIAQRQASALGAASGAVAGLVAITPACGFVGLAGALVIGFVAGIGGFWGVNGLKRMLGADDSLDVFGVHGVCGILGALLTGVFAAPSLGGSGIYDYVATRPRPTTRSGASS